MAAESPPLHGACCTDTPSSPCIGEGTSASFLVPFPHCPSRFHPEAKHAPSCRATIVWPNPRAKPVRCFPARPSITRDVAAFSRVPCPSWPEQERQLALGSFRKMMVGCAVIDESALRLAAYVRPGYEGRRSPGDDAGTEGFPPLSKFLPGICRDGRRRGQWAMPVSADKPPSKVPPNELEMIRPGILARFLIRIFQSWPESPGGGDLFSRSL